jgi:hypothetical protein
MPDKLVSTTQLLDKLCREEQQLKQLGLHAQAQGVRSAITALLRLTQEPDPGPQAQPLDPSDT